MAENEIFYIHNITQDILLPYINQTFNVSRHDLNSLHRDSELTLREILIIVCYTLIVVVSVFGNLLVCNIVARKASMRRTTYVFIANLAFSDLLMTVLNIPFNIARVLLKNWPFGSFMCILVPLVQVTSVYVSTFTMMFIALDRYRVICKPLMPRLTPLQASKVIVIIWIVAIALSLPHGIFNKLEDIFTDRPLIRCRTKYPYNMSRWIILVTFLTQYVLPLSVTGMAYFFIIARVWSRDVLGVVTEAQIVKQAKAKWKTIKMLVIVVILFAVLWLPLNMYNLVDEFTRDTGKTYLKKSGFYNSTIYFICHWLAMSSLCCNPFIYCWLNKNFRSGAYSCFICLRHVGQRLNASFRSTRETRLTDVHFEFQSQSYDSRTDSMYQSSNDFAVCCSTAKHQPDHKIKALRMGLQKQCVRETIPMKTVNLEKPIHKSASMHEKTYTSKHHSITEIENGLYPNKTEHYPIKRCISWNQ